MMKATSKTSAAILIMALALAAFPLLLRAASDQSDPKVNVITITDEAGKEIKIGALLRVEYDDQTQVVNKVAYELENQTEGVSFTVEKIRIRNSHDEKWLQAPGQAVAGGTKGTREFSDEALKSAGASRKDLELQLQLSTGGQSWVLHWKPDKPGPESTWTAPGQW
jgi:hypothetical protein